MDVTSGSFRLDLKSGEVTGKRLGVSGAERRALRAAQGGAAGQRRRACPSRNSAPPTAATSCTPSASPTIRRGTNMCGPSIDAATGERLGQAKSHVRFAPFFVTGTLLVTVSGPELRQTEQGAVESRSRSRRST